METAEVTRQKLIADLKLVIADAEELLRASASQTGAQMAAMRERIQASLENAKQRLGAAGESTMDTAKVAATATDKYVRDNPWQAVGIAAAAGVVLGLLLNRR
jgi:ElaB/YqjD/DUF883 family membrane-anchored ribosome-binding protein